MERDGYLFSGAGKNSGARSRTVAHGPPADETDEAEDGLDEAVAEKLWSAAG